MAPKMKAQTSCLFSFSSFRKIWAKLVLEVCFDLKNAPNMKRNAVVFFWRSFSVEFFSGKFGEIREKSFAHPKLSLLLQH